MRTTLNKWYDVTNEGDLYPTYTRDTWEIPEEGTEVWCTLWPRGQTIKPYGDGAHITVGLTVYHCDEFMGILLRNEKEGYPWGLEGITMTREQRNGGEWRKVEV
jgi:hypothetical protein